MDAKKFLSIEIWIAVTIPLIIGVFGYGQLYAGVDDNSAAVEAVRTQSTTTQNTVQAIKTDVAVIKSKLENISNQIEKNQEEQERKSVENERLMREILRRLPPDN